MWTMVNVQKMICFYFALSLVPFTIVWSCINSIFLVILIFFFFFDRKFQLFFKFRLIIVQCVPLWIVSSVLTTILNQHKVDFTMNTLLLIQFKPIDLMTITSILFIWIGFSIRCFCCYCWSRSRFLSVKKILIHGLFIL